MCLNRKLPDQVGILIGDSMHSMWTNMFSHKTCLFIITASIFYFTFVILPSVPKVRQILAAPLVVNDPKARGSACYVLAGGDSLWERLDAAADLVQRGRVPLIMLMQDNMRGHYSFKANSSWSRAKWANDYLAWRGVSSDRIVWIPEVDGTFGTLTEARHVAENLPKNMKALVVVSSAPHMRRSVLAFRRSLVGDVKVVPYAASEFMNSYEMYHPIWIEYFKLFIYSIIA